MREQHSHGPGRNQERSYMQNGTENAQRTGKNKLFLTTINMPRNAPVWECGKTNSSRHAHLECPLWAHARQKLLACDSQQYFEPLSCTTAWSLRKQNKSTATETTALKLGQEDRPRGQHHIRRLDPHQQPTCVCEFCHPPRKCLLSPANKSGDRNAKRTLAP